MHIFPHMLSFLTSFIDDERIPNFVCSFSWHVIVACNPLQPTASYEQRCSSTCFYAYLRAYFVYMYSMYFYIPSVPFDRNFCKFLFPFYMLLSVACNPWQPFSHSRNVMLIIALFLYIHIYVHFLYFISLQFPSIETSVSFYTLFICY
jgi:hypothetical protein